MLKTAIEKARARLKDAERELGQAKRSMAFELFHNHWSKFLVAGNGVYASLEKGAVASPQSRQWWHSGKTNERRLDPLLDYMFQARHAAEHGLEPLLVPLPDERGLGRASQGYFFGWESETGTFHHKGGDERDPANFFQVAPPEAAMATIHNDKWKQTFDPPNHHFGKPLADLEPIAIGLLWLRHLEAIITEAESLPQIDAHQP